MSDPLVAVRCRGITKSFPMGDGAVEVLHGINLEVPAGELTMLVGPSGCGKTTLISIIAGILSPTSGEVETCGKPLTRMSDAEKVAFRRSNIGFIHVRVDIDETETWRIRPGHAALARLRGNPEISAPLSFVRFEPYVLPKRSLTGGTTERVDTRVLQAIYAFAPSAFPAFVGQQVDVFIAAPSRAAATRSPTSGQIAFSPVFDTWMQIAGGASNMLPASGAGQPSH
jgi:energy-coupling factor transporter ATP-binding protein EcfA2